ncbi:glutamyl-tRNA reductase [Halorubellus sp. JP-L1]|uniref:glutamyl-tRNA reductase n=1 Tax=Halorubellus sp. JP-L1 TaxID=2715753 RepID=UPI0014080A9C|nr:glutamyl-tRNA reductase [Halorubellus sp. JP-L1]NHN41336.1 glutamyl-tRNA reductase [Halorubellus sp. JP-L1]
MKDTGVITGVRVTHSTGSVDDVAAASRRESAAVLGTLAATDGVEEAFVLQTCNRAEAYVVTTDVGTGRAALAEYGADAAEDARVEMSHEESLEHLLRVAAGLDSLVLGEDQVLGQVRDALETAQQVGTASDILEDAVLKAVHVGERARTETDVNEGVVSLGSAAAERVAAERDLAGATAVVVGAGEMGTLAARALADRGVGRVVVANRTVSNAEHVAGELDVETEPVPLSALDTVLDRADVVLSATSSDEFVVEAGDLDGERDVTVVDLAQPRDVDPAVGDLSSVSVHDLDTLEDLTAETRENRREAADAVERIVGRELENLLEQFKRQRADEVIAAMYESAERVKERELETALSKLDLDDAEAEVVESMADSLVSQLLSAPTKSLRDAAADDDWSTINTALQLFDPEFGSEGMPPAVAAMLAADDSDDAPSEPPLGAFTDDD